ncbi:unnamed protein product [Spirodela intermedia]|uniref:Uncharacterized protein n=1 Tax=Spirodela intermedia TaxID=51605 RepID=A0A7I8IRZ6_SPIIN|nr:unnamed protein product [Spirodela intermedia]CAA6660775.1 unnamed protein product [Spirodela intermedia]
MQYIPATAPKFDRSMKWVVESSPAAVTGGAEKRRLCGSPVAVTRRRGAGWRRWRLVSRRIVLFPTTACSSINRR